MILPVCQDNRDKQFTEDRGIFVFLKVFAVVSWYRSVLKHLCCSEKQNNVLCFKFSNPEGWVENLRKAEHRINQTTANQKVLAKCFAGEEEGEPKIVHFLLWSKLRSLERERIFSLARAVCNERDSRYKMLSHWKFSEWYTLGCLI